MSEDQGHAFGQASGLCIECKHRVLTPLGPKLLHYIISLPVILFRTTFHCLFFCSLSPSLYISPCLSVVPQKRRFQVVFESSERLRMSAPTIK